MRVKTASEIAVEDACEHIDAAIFTGGLLYQPENVAALKEYLGRWQRAITEREEKVAYEQTKNPQRR